MKGIVNLAKDAMKRERAKMAGIAVRYGNLVKGFICLKGQFTNITPHKIVQLYTNMPKKT